MWKGRLQRAGNDSAEEGISPDTAGGRRGQVMYLPLAALGQEFGEVPD